MMTLLFWILGILGTAELAAGSVLTQLTLLGILPLIGFGIAAATLVGNALGRGDTPDAARWGWEVGTFAMVVMGTLALPIALYPQVPLALFLHDPATLELARIPLRLVAATLWIDALGTVLLNAHIGAGSTRRVMQISVSLQWGGFLPVAYLLGPVLGHGLLAIWLANVCYRAIQAGVFVRSWSRGSWASVRI